VAVPTAPTRPLGTLASGWGAGYGVAIDSLEHVTDLMWPLSVQTYSRMRHDPTLTSVIAGYRHPILKADWRIDPRGASDRMVKICADSLGLPVLGQPDQPGPVRRRGVKWLDHLRLAVNGSLIFGHSPFEPTYDTSTGSAMLAALGERLPQSIAFIDVNDDGTLKSISQVGTVTAPNPDPIPGDRLLWYVRDREGAAWQGNSILRPAFGPWLLKQDALRVHATSLRRFGAGTPVMTPEPGTQPTAAQIAAAQAAATQIRVGDSAAITVPGFKLEILGITGTVPDGLPFLAYLDQQMARAALASMLDLGNTSHGTRALGETFADLLGMAQQSTANSIAEQATELCVKLTDYNEGDTANAPAVIAGDVTATGQSFAQGIALLVQAGAISVDDGVEDWIRQSVGAPARTTPRPTPPAAPPPGTPPAGQPADPGAMPEPTKQPVAAASRVAAATGDQPTPDGRRPLTPEEEAAGLDPAAIDQAHEQALAAVLAAWARSPQRSGPASSRRSPPPSPSGDREAVAQLVLDTTDAAEVLATAMLEAADAGAVTAIAEAAAQGVTIEVPAIDTAALEQMAAAVTDVMGQTTAATASREALRLAGSTGDVDAAAVAADVGAHLAGLSDAWQAEQLGGAVSDGINAGRRAVLAAGPAQVTYRASEVRDKATCQPCLDIDGHVFPDLAAAEAAYASGGYNGCLGRLRCRGIIFANYLDGA
jgi:hypothetical protein